ncbi:alanine racemase [Reinekea sp.]|jgi:alanine racemase|uniref:alanine racemase n=1 Tax=Reinekea sp. TaxID=1970455 RepID=UPI002A83C093|nr:alanine racemase [Reinekea sp.]
MNRGTQALIDPSALAHNLQCVRQWAPQALVWAVVKANAYGHGVERAAQALHRADGYAVATLGEAIELRRHQPEHPILLLEGVNRLAQLAQVADYQIQTVVHCQEQLDHLRQTDLQRAGAQPLSVWLKVDTGMHRLGFAPSDLGSARTLLAGLAGVHLEGVMTHLACADEPNRPDPTEQQLTRFGSCLRPGEQVSIANSAAVIAWPDTHHDWVRPGIMLYGSSPFAERDGVDLGLRPVMTLTAPVLAVRSVLAGEAIGYGQAWRAERDSRIATLAIGYGDGYPRQAPNGTPIWLNGQTVALAGRVSMDMLMVDVTDLAPVAVGDSAELWGAHLSVDRVARAVGTIGYELLTRLTARVERV